MGYTLRAALDLLPQGASVEVCEIEPVVVRWCRGPLAKLTDGAVDDPRVEVREGDIAIAIADAARSGSEGFDAIALDLFEGPRGTRDERDHPHYGERALATARRALRPGGVLALWTEEAARGFERRAVGAGFELALHRAGRGGRRHVIYVLAPRTK
jgi:spermidine synthase